MNETLKASQSHNRVKLYAKYLRGVGMDLGCGNDCLRLDNCTIRGWDLPDGDAQFLQGVENNSQDFIFSSHALEHMQSARGALINWSRVVKPGGYLMIVVPSWTFYENRLAPPSSFNSDHKQYFDVLPMPDDNGMSPFLSVGAMIEAGHVCDLRLCELFLELDGYDFGLMNRPTGIAFDQTAHPFNAQAQILYVFRKEGGGDLAPEVTTQGDNTETGKR